MARRYRSSADLLFWHLLFATIAMVEKRRESNQIGTLSQLGGQLDTMQGTRAIGIID
jgi:hypothetical protein